MRYLNIWLFVCLLASLPFVSAARDDNGVILPDTLCRVSCIDDEVGDTYTVAMSVKAWMNHEDADSCGLDVQKYVYKNDDLMEGIDSSVRYIDPTEEVNNYGGYVYEYHDEEERGDETYSYGFLNAFLEDLTQYDLLWSLLYASNISLSQDSASITATYNHKIDPCAAQGTYVEVHASCDATGTDADEVFVYCIVYKDGEGQDTYTDIVGAAEVEFTWAGDCRGEDCDEIYTMDDSEDALHCQSWPSGQLSCS